MVTVFGALAGLGFAAIGQASRDRQR